MNSGFWSTLKKPVMALAPMANVTDAAFRRIIAKYGKFTRPDGTTGGGPDVMWTEFVSVEGLLSAGREKLLPDFWFTDAERPIVAQVFGGKPEQFAKVAELIRELGFDGIDINMGCPDSGVEKSGGGAALIKNPELAKKIIRATQDASGGLPVSVKTRLGYNKNEAKTWLPELLGTGLAALIVHLRTRKEMSDVPAHWELASEIAATRNKHSPDTLILGNGDVESPANGRMKAALSDIDGAMIGRGIFGNPWLFAESTPDIREKLRVMTEHTALFEELYKSNSTNRLKNFDVMKKHYKAYANGFDGARELRVHLMEAEDAAEVRKITGKFLKERGL